MPKPEIALYSVQGRKHRSFQLNEDRVYHFDFKVNITSTLQLEIQVACLTDGHGARPRQHPSEEDLKNTHQGQFKTPGDWFCSLLQQELPHIVKQVCCLHPKLTKTYLCQNNEHLESTSILDQVFSQLRETLTHPTTSSATSSSLATSPKESSNSSSIAKDTSTSANVKESHTYTQGSTSLPTALNSLNAPSSTHQMNDSIRTTAPSFEGTSFFTSMEFQEYVSKVYHLFTHFREIMNTHLNDMEPQVCHGAGSTLCMGIQFGPVFFAVNIGDSTMLFWDHQKELIPKRWSIEPLVFPCCTQLPKSIPPLPKFTMSSDLSMALTQLFPCSYEDTIVDFPHVIKEGQPFFLVERDFFYVKPNLKPNRTANTLCSPFSNKNLRMINTLGNMGHRNVLVPRTTVYAFALPLLDPCSFVMLSDGITDLFSMQELTTFFKIKSPKELVYHIASSRHRPTWSLPTQLNQWKDVKFFLESYASCFAPFEQLDDVSKEAIPHVVQLFQSLTPSASKTTTSPTSPTTNANQTHSSSSSSSNGTSSSSSSSSSSSNSKEVSNASFSNPSSLRPFHSLTDATFPTPHSSTTSSTPSGSLHTLSKDPSHSSFGSLSSLTITPSNPSSSSTSSSSSSSNLDLTTPLLPPHSFPTSFYCELLVELARLKGAIDDVSCVIWNLNGTKSKFNPMHFLSLSSSSTNSSPTSTHPPFFVSSSLFQSQKIPVNTSSSSSSS